MILDNPLYFNNRELSWLAFNERVLEEANDWHNPLLERLHFLSIFSSNLDEFFMVRVAGLKDQVEANFNRPESKAGMTPKKQLSAISKKAHTLIGHQYDILKNQIEPLLVNEGIGFLGFKELTAVQKERLEAYFDEQVFPVLTPIAVDAYRPFPILANKSLNVAVSLHSEDVDKIGIVQVPSVLPRYIRTEGFHYVLLEDIISAFLSKLFVGYDVGQITHFRITRNADMTIDEEGARDLLKEIEKELTKRKWGSAVRLELRKPADGAMLAYLQDELEIHEKDVFEVDGPLDLTFLGRFYREISHEHEELTFQSLIPQPPKDLSSHEDMFAKLLEQDILIHHPFESFQTVVDFIDEASKNPDVLAIKQTLYRISSDSPIITSLKYAAQQGKQVMVLVELKARFDEENNVEWAKQLEKAGCHVIYGINFLKTHSKITLVVRRQNQKIQRFVHLGTGNYNDTTAKFYTDLSLLTSNEQIGIDATNFFNFLSGDTIKPHYHELSVAPMDIRNDFIDLIDREIQFQKEHGNGHIIAKMNSLTDKVLILKMYEASIAGVKIELIVRGTCCLRPQIEGVSDNITVRSIVGRFLEHTRIYYFHQNGAHKTFLSSADLMTRNMEKRVEISFPVLQENLKARIKEILDIYLSDNVKAREQSSEGTYHYVENTGENLRNSQLILYEQAYQVTDDEE
ncbi:MAG: RNA degradosome polyphosphate kinase [Turicibacter sp.]|nr:RNA degradosome polyphosphate kinase [Turicibacter sp.]